MFRKEPHIKALSNLKNSDRKKLAQTIHAQTGNDKYTCPSIVKQTNFQTPTTIGTIYTDEKNIPIWFKEKHDPRLYATVYTCWNCEDLLPICLSHDFVIQEKLFNGANLMISGTIPPFDEKLKVGTLCGVASCQDPGRVVYAIGIVMMDLPKFEKVVGESGVAVQIIHHFEDELFKSFKIDLKPPVVDVQKGSVNDEEEEEEEKEQEKANEEDETTKEMSTATNVEDLAEVLDHLSVQDVDYFITRALYYTITTDTKLSLPISASNFISQHINKNLPDVDHNEVNIKKSSWKKTAKFLKHFEKEGFLKLKGKGDDLTVVGMNKTKDESVSYTHLDVYKRQDYKCGTDCIYAPTKTK